MTIMLGFDPGDLGLIPNTPANIIKMEVYMDFIEDVIDTAEDTILDALYDLFSEKRVDEFMKNYNDEVITPEIASVIEDLNELILERIEKLQDEINDEDEEMEE